MVSIFRENYLNDLSWQTYNDLGMKPDTGVYVYALSGLDKKWYRGVIEDDSSVRVCTSYSSF